MQDLKGKVALVTGGASGFGKAIEELLLSKGCMVAVLDMDVERGRKTAADFQSKYGKERCVFYKCDVTDDQEFEDCFSKTKSKFGGLDIVVNNAGVAGEARWKKIFAINTEAVFCGTLLGFKYMGKDNGHKGGHIINVASVAGLVLFPAIPAYNASKYAVVAMTRSLGTDLHFNRHGVKVNCICPEPMDTPLWWGVSEFCKTKDDTTSFAQDYDKRVQRIEDVAKGVVKIIEDGQNGSALVALHGQDFKYYNFQE